MAIAPCGPPATLEADATCLIRVNRFIDDCFFVEIVKIGVDVVVDDESDVLSEAISSWAENYPSIQEAQAKLLEPLPPIAKASEKAAVSGESSESQLRDRLNKQALKNAILL